MELLTKLDELTERIEVDFPDKFLAISGENLVKKDGSIFFSKAEVIELAEMLKETDTIWRLPTLVELKLACAELEYDEEVSDGLTGEDYCDLFGNEGYLGKELISGTVRTPLKEEVTCYWSDLSVAGGAMKISPAGVSFEFERPSSEEKSRSCTRFYDHPDCEFGYCVRLVAEV